MPHRTPLGDLIQSTQTSRGWSNRDVEKNASGRSGLGQGNLTKLKNQPLTSIKGETLVGLAETLGLSTELVVRAALRSLKAPIELNNDVGTPEEAIQIDPDLSAADRNTLLRMLKVMRTEAGGTRGNTTPITQPRYTPGPDTAITEGEDNFVPPPAGYEYDLAADDSPSVGRERHRRLDESEGA